MPKNKGKGGKNRRRGKNESSGLKRELIQKEDGQEYGSVLRMLGNGRLEAYCTDNVKRLCHIRGKMRKKVWVSAGDIVLVSLRDFQDAKGDVILKYTPEEARQLKADGMIPETFKINEDDGGDDYGDIDFRDSSGSDEDSSSDDDDAGDEAQQKGKAAAGGGKENGMSSIAPPASHAQRTFHAGDKAHQVSKNDEIDLEAI